MDWAKRNWSKALLLVLVACALWWAGEHWTLSQLADVSNVVMALASMAGVYGLMTWKSQRQAEREGERQYQLAHDLSVVAQQVKAAWADAIEQVDHDRHASFGSFADDYQPLISTSRSFPELLARLGACVNGTARPVEELQRRVRALLGYATAYRRNIALTRRPTNMGSGTRSGCSG